MDQHLTPATPTILHYHDDMFKLQSTATLLSSFLGDDGRHVIILDSTIFHPQGGGQPSDTGFITDVSSSRFKFVVQDARSKNGIVYHYGVFEKTAEDLEGVQVVLSVDESNRKLNSRLHSAGHLLDVCLPKVGLGHLKPGKAYHFSDGPYVEYKGTVPQAELHSKQMELELEANNLISRGVKVSVGVYSYEEASMLCGGDLPDYIPKVKWTTLQFIAASNVKLTQSFPFWPNPEFHFSLSINVTVRITCHTALIEMMLQLYVQGSTPRVVKLGDFPGCPCGGTHVSNISDLVNMKVTQIRTKKGFTKVYYNIGGF